MTQMDELRVRDGKAQNELKYLKERLKMFEGTSASGFKGFGGTAQNPQTNGVGNIQDLKLVSLNQDTLKKLPSGQDPISNFLSLANKFHFLVHSLQPSLKKDTRQLWVEQFHRQCLFTGKGAQGGATAKNEMLKVMNGSRDIVLNPTTGAPLHKELTYEALSQIVEDLLKENGFYQ
ncbi:hypothetical protein FGO68_gene13259 [Halteria grandinella]|uniref:Uncharacterized protein n=1 Tax=Halteria grandinella TaxID=5974 RepID=A0A8J8NZK8_HALGN|nr:hypothetical protein FGO68_gene13259 [Halteria grandinella]